jgi:ribosomal protein S18 acetylase RimI-like enzyme
MRGIVVRNGLPEEIDAALAVYLASNDARRNGQPTPAHHVERVRVSLGNPEAIFLVAVDDNVCVGMALAMQSRADYGTGLPEPGICFISMIFVSPDCWGKGIGGKLVDAVIAEAQSRDYTLIQLWTHANNLRAQHLYERHGFSRTDLEHKNDLGEAIVKYEFEFRLGSR